MSVTRVDRFIEGRLVVPVAASITLLIGLFFVFVRAPHPFGWFGIDQYHYLAMDMATGGEFATLDVPWGYAYVLAAFYRVFGPAPLPVLLVQVVLNAAIPAIVYAWARDAFDRRVAAVAALLLSVLSFNTIYASTESTDSICTFLFVVMVWLFVRARRTEPGRATASAVAEFAAVGALCGLASQFRPNLILVPLVLWGMHGLPGPRTTRRFLEGALIVAVAALMLAPWTIRNYRLTGQFLPTSTHGGVQLWYGTLQTGPYLRSRALNPRSIFDAAAFDYTSLRDVPLLVDTDIGCGPGLPERMDLVYRIDGGAPQRLNLAHTTAAHYAGALPAPHRPIRLTYFIEVVWPAGVTDPAMRTMPAGGEADPLMYFVSDNHLGDLDTDDRLLDTFDIIRLLRHLAWNESVGAAGRLDADGNGTLNETDLRQALRKLLKDFDRGEPSIDRLSTITTTDSLVTAKFIDGSSLSIPRQWNEKLTDVALDYGFAGALVSARHRWAQPYPTPRIPLSIQCLAPGAVEINRPFYRLQPHEQRRYTALAFDNIARDPLAYAWSVLYRAVRLFIIEGDDDRRTAHQFEGSRAVYAVGFVASLIYFVLFGFGARIAWKRGYAVWLPLALIAYLPATISFVLTNMRYTITVQPLMLVFVAVAVVAVVDRVGARSIDP